MPGKKILVVEDEFIIQTLFRRLLKAPAYEFTMASTVREGLEALDKGFLPDLLISDLRLPDGYGTDVILRFHKLRPEAPVIIMTGSPTPESRLADLDGIRVEATVNKPFEIENFLQVVGRCLP